MRPARLLPLRFRIARTGMARRLASAASHASKSSHPEASKRSRWRSVCIAPRRTLLTQIRSGASVRARLTATFSWAARNALTTPWAASGATAVMPHHPGGNVDRVFGLAGVGCVGFDDVRAGAARPTGRSRARSGGADHEHAVTDQPVDGGVSDTAANPGDHCAAGRIHRRPDSCRSVRHGRCRAPSGMSIRRAAPCRPGLVAATHCPAARNRSDG